MQKVVVSIQVLDTFNMDNTSRIEALRGNFHLVNQCLASISWEAPKRKLLVFASSTFTDTHDERTVILEKILPNLRTVSRSKGVEVIILDLRSGIPDANTLDHMTWLGILLLMHLYS